MGGRDKIAASNSRKRIWAPRCQYRHCECPLLAGSFAKKPKA